jgi:hypothetical protein
MKRIQMKIPLLLSLAAGSWLLLAAGQAAQEMPATPTATNRPAAAKVMDNTPLAPAVLPGNGLAQHDFFYAGEGSVQNMYIVRKGKVVWSYTDTKTKGEISDAVLMSTGNVLFAHQFGVTEITADKKVVWNYDAPAGVEIHTAQHVGKDRVWFIQNGNPAKLKVVNIVTGETEKQFVLPVRNATSTHMQFRQARLTEAGTILVAHMDRGKICEYDATGKELLSLDVPSPWSAVSLKDGNILVASNRGFVRELSRSGETVWEFRPADLPEIKIAGMQTATRLPNGNTLINNWRGKGNGTAVQAFEVTLDKKLVWALRSWTEPDLGPSTIIQLLDNPGIPENNKFGDIQ